MQNMFLDALQKSFANPVGYEDLGKNGYNPDQPRNPAGSGVDSGRWSDGGGGAASTSTSDRVSKPNVDAAIRHLQLNAKTASSKKCATYVRNALNAGGFNVKPIGGEHGHAKDLGPRLEESGFRPTAKATQLDKNPIKDTYPPIGYKPEKLDVAVIQETSKNKSGHAAIYDGKQWISDYKQQEFWPSHRYKAEQPSFVIYRK